MQKGRIAILGGHTVAAESGLQLPRYQINVGHRNRVRDSLSMLNLKDAVLLDVENGKMIGRKAMAKGKYHGKKGEREILIVETGIGMPTVQIIQEEMVAYSASAPIIQIRVGTAGGVNDEKSSPPVLRLGDLVVSSFNVGTSGAIEQRMRYFRKFVQDEESGRELEEFRSKWKKLDGRFTEDMRFLINDNDQAVVRALCDGADSFGYRYHIGGTLSKDDLHVEENREIMHSLRRQGVLSSEMEQLQNAFVSAIAGMQGVPVISGMVSAIIGAVPGDGFPETASEKEEAQATVKKALKVAAEALCRI